MACPLVFDQVSGCRVGSGLVLGCAGGPAGSDDGQVSVRLECDSNQELRGSKCWWVFQPLDRRDQRLI